MNIEIVNSTYDNKRAILIFLGWAMDCNVLAGVTKPGYDIVAVSDYIDGSGDFGFLARYDEIVVIGWSMGVVYGGEFINSHRHLPVTATIAVNGSTAPRSDTQGIPVKVYDLTGLISTQKQLDAFYRRTSGGASKMERLMPVKPAVTVDKAVRELAAITSHVNATATHNDVWDTIIITAKDLIFPFDNLKNCWKHQSERIVVIKEGAHLPDFSYLLERYVIDKGLVEQRFGSAMPRYNEGATVQAIVADDMLEGMTVVTGLEVLEIGAGAGLLTSRLQRHVHDCLITAVDLVKMPLPAVNGNTINTVQSDGELIVKQLPAQSYDLIVSSSTMQWFNSPRRFIGEIYRLLKPGGRALLSTYGSGTFAEITQLMPSAALPYLPVDCVDIIANGADVSVKSRVIEQQFDTPADAIAHLRRTGVNATSRRLIPVSAMRRLMSMLEQPDGSASLKYESVIISISKPY